MQTIQHVINYAHQKGYLKDFNQFDFAPHEQQVHEIHLVETAKCSIYLISVNSVLGVLTCFWDA